MSAETDELDAQAESIKQPRASQRKKLVIAASVVLLLAAVAGGAMFFMGGDEAHAESDEMDEAMEVGFIDVPPMVVNLRSSDGQARFLKLHFLIVPANAEKKAEIDAKMPLIIDRFQPFLRELRPEDLAGSAAVYRIKEELIVRAGKVVGTGGVRDILIQDLIEQ